MGRRRFSEKKEKTDFISCLPRCLIDTILTKLPIRDAVRTSILSSKWRYQWANLTQLVFNKECVHPPYTQEKLTQFMMPFLFLHDGPIHSFKLITPPICNSPVIDQCLLFLSRKGIKELDLQVDLGPPVIVESQKLPTPIFSCQQLTKLVLSRFVVQPPPNFRVFPCLKHLNLNLCTVTLKVIESFISGCPLLESFEIDDYKEDQQVLTVNAPNLKHLTVAGTFRDIHLEHTPLLAVITVDFFSEVWKGDVFVKLSTTYNNLKFIEAVAVNFQEKNEVLCVQNLLLHSPNLEKLQISAAPFGYGLGYAADLNLWDREGLADFKFKHLKSVNMWYVSNEYDMKFIEFVLGRSPVLQMMTISLGEDCIQKMNVVNKVLHFRPASPEVDITFFD